MLDKVPALARERRASRRGHRRRRRTPATLNSADDLRLLVTTVRERLGIRPGGRRPRGRGRRQARRDRRDQPGGARRRRRRPARSRKTAAGVLGGGGGGKDDLAQGGGTDVDAIPAALGGRDRRRSADRRRCDRECGSASMWARSGSASAAPTCTACSPRPSRPCARSEDGADRRRIAGIVTELGAFEIIVGLPLALSGAHTASTADAVGFADRSRGRPGCAGAARRRAALDRVRPRRAPSIRARTRKAARPVVDQVAATIILQHALDAERATGHPPGTLVEPNIGP